MPEMKGFGVYQIVNTVTGMAYIGSTARTFLARYRHHWHLLKAGTHRNSRLQRAWDKYGADAFEFCILEVLDDPAQAVVREQHHLDRVFGPGCYNARPEAASNRGWSPAPETRRRMAAASKGHKRLTAEIRRTLSEKAKGYYLHLHTPEARAKAADAKRGRKRGEAFGALMRDENVARCADPAYVERITAHLMTDEFREQTRQRFQKTVPGVLVSPDGREFPGVVNVSRFCKAHGLNGGALGYLIRGKFAQHKGWTYRPAEPVPDRRPDVAAEPAPGAGEGVG